MALGLESESLERMEERSRSFGKSSWFCRRRMVGVRWRNALGFDCRFGFTATWRNPALGPMSALLTLGLARRFSLLSQ